MADIVPSLFGLTPEMYEQQIEQSALKRGVELSKLTPIQRANAGIYAGAAGIGRAVGGMLGVEDPQMQKITLRNQLLKEMDLTDIDSVVATAKKAASIGDAEFAAGLIDRAKKMEESNAAIALKQAQTVKALQPEKLTGDERYIQALRIVETKLQKGEKPTSTELSNANISGQMLSKPRSFFDQSSGQTVTIPATDPSQAFPLTYKAMAKPEEEAGIPTPKPTVQATTAGNLPASSQTAIGEIDASLVKLEKSKPELQSFLNSLKTGEVKYNATSNTLDLLGATVLPAFGLAEQGAQVKKDEIKRALTERVNTLLLMAKGTQTEGDASRAADQIASTTTYLSQNRMIGAIEGLMRAEAKLSEELGAKKTALQSQGRTSAPNQPSAPAPKPSAPSVKPQQKPTELTREQKIQRFIDFNGGKPTRQQAIDALTKAGQL